MSWSDGLVPSPIFRAMNRPSLFMGGDRELVLMTFLITFALIFVSLKPIVAIIGLSLSVVIIQALRIMAKADPNMRFVYMRHIKYRAFYRKSSTPFIKG